MKQDTDLGATERWARVCEALALLAVCPGTVGGLLLRARSGPVRDRVMSALGALPLAWRKVPCNVTDEALFGGVNLSATLADGKVIHSAGVLSGGPVAMIVPMAEQLRPGIAARLSQALDARDGHCILALDEGAEPGEATPSTLSDRLAIHLDLTGLAMGDCPEPVFDSEDLLAARNRVAQTRVPLSAISALCTTAIQLGILGMRAPVYAVAVARASAALDGRGSVSEDDLITAVELVLVPRATRFPGDVAPAPDPSPPEPASSTPKDTDGTQPEESLELPDELLLEAAKALLPDDLLARVAARSAAARGGAGIGSGVARKGFRRGRPLPPRGGRLGSQTRMDLVATLRAAAPWQRIRRRSFPSSQQKVLIRSEDIRVRRYEECTDRLLIFAVDASGSSAFARLAEAKGAVEILLSEAYARRDHVALVSFRGDAADVLLPPTRSLVQTKRRLSALPGGGGTPLASGLKTALALSDHARGRGMTPTVVLLTDGRANIALDGVASRAQAAEDAHLLARALRATATPALVIDTGARPQRGLEELAAHMGAPYIPMPRAVAKRLSDAVSAAIDP